MVVAGCSQRLYADEFEAVMRGAGLDPRLLARVNLREQVVYPHSGNGQRPGAKGPIAGGHGGGGAEGDGRGGGAEPGRRQALTRRALVVGGGRRA